jgi:hypothetical protein
MPTTVEVARAFGVVGLSSVKRYANKAVAREGGSLCAR